MEGSLTWIQEYRTGSNPVTLTNFNGHVGKWLKPTGCNPVSLRGRGGSNPSMPTIFGLKRLPLAREYR